jgi:hypothetical protein
VISKYSPARGQEPAAYSLHNAALGRVDPFPMIFICRFIPLKSQQYLDFHILAKPSCLKGFPCEWIHIALMRTTRAVSLCCCIQIPDRNCRHVLKHKTVGNMNPDRMLEAMIIPGYRDGNPNDNAMWIDPFLPRVSCITRAPSIALVAQI